MAETEGANIMSPRPAMTSVRASPVPLYGICVMSMPACILNISPLRCVELPEPAESKFSAPGVALAAATTSRTDLYLLAALTTSTLGTLATSETGAKSFTVS
ncbi:hypothetical protein D9M72_539140 [compost metagenome]